VPTASVILQLQNQAGATIASAASQVGALAAAEQRAALQILQRQQAAAKLLTTTSQLALADQRVAAAASQAALVDQRVATEAARTAVANDRAAVAALKRADAERKAAQAAQNGGLGSALPRTFAGFSSESAAGQFAGGIAQGIGAVVGPAAAATAALGGAAAAAQSFREALQFKGELDQTNAAVAYQVGRLRDYDTASAEAQAFADRFKLTQAQLSQTMQAAIPVYRQSKESTTDILTTFALLQATAPEQPINEAARAIRELATGDVTSIKELFNVPAKDALAMKNAIVQGQDPIKVVSEYLKRSGADANLLKIGVEGTAGAFKDAAKAAEALKLAQGELAASKGGLGLLDLQTKVTTGLSRVLGGSGGIQGGILGLSQNADPGYGAMRALAQGLLDLQRAAQETNPVLTQDAEAILKLGTSGQVTAPQLDAIRSGIDQARQVGGPAAATVNALVREYANGTIQTPAFVRAIGQLTGALNAQALAAQRAEERTRAAMSAGQLANTGPVDATKNYSYLGGPGQRGNDVKDFDKFIADQKAAEVAARRQAEALADTAGRVKIYRDELTKLRANGATQAEIIDKETQLKQAEQQLAEERKRGRVGAAQTTALQLADIERNSAAEIERIQRESNERLADMQEDFRNRQGDSEDDYQRRRRRLLAEGKRFEAEQLRQDFERQRARDTRDEQIRERRQARDTAEQLADQGGRVDRRTDSVTARAALRGVKAGALPPSPGGGSSGGTTAAGGDAVAASGGGSRVIQVPIKFVINGREFAVQLMDAGLRQLIDDDLVLELEAAGLNPPDVARRATQGAGS